MAVRLSALWADPLYPPGIFLELISVRGWVDPRVIVRLEWLGKLKISSDLIGSRTRNLPACSIVPQPTTPPRAPVNSRCPQGTGLLTTDCRMPTRKVVNVWVDDMYVLLILTAVNMTELARTSSSCKRQTRPLVREGASHEQTRSCLTVKRNLVLSPTCGLTRRQTGRLTVGLTLTLTWVVESVESCSSKKKLIAEVGDSSETQRKGNVRRWKPLPSNG
jgi:hypothetical protein